MSIKGLKVVKGKKCHVCYVEDFSAELKSEIKDRLSEIFHGISEVNSSPLFYSYNNTLKSFLERYNSKDEDTKKGMIGELLAHLLLSKVYKEHRSISILKNKEEKSIKKGFDILYFDLKRNKIWYSEVKSGSSSAKKESSTDYNIILLKRAKTDIAEKLESGRNLLWESAMIDAELAMSDSAQKIKLKDLLSSESPVMSKDPKSKKNAIMISVLYNDLKDEIKADNVDGFHDEVVNENKFLETIVFSIQKATYKKIADFIQSEVK